MTLLIDRILSGEKKIGYVQAETNIGDLEDHAAMCEYMMSCAEQAVVFDIQNVFDYFASSDQTLWRFDQDFPNVAPVYPVMWMEFSRLGQRIAWLFVSEQLDEADGPKWWSNAFMFRDDREWSGIVIAPSPVIAYGANEDGSCSRAQGNERGGVMFKGSTNEDAKRLVQHIFPCMLALSFLHCKNVIVSESDGQYANRQERRLAQRRNDDPLVTFHTLQIEPMKKVIQNEGSSEKNGLKKALHICRGHFAEYGDQYGKGKLFGRLEGRFFIQPHVRGSADVGVADKDYAVKPPKRGSR